MKNVVFFNNLLLLLLVVKRHIQRYFSYIVTGQMSSFQILICCRAPTPWAACRAYLDTGTGTSKDVFFLGESNPDLLIQSPAPLPLRHRSGLSNKSDEHKIIEWITQKTKEIHRNVITWFYLVRQSVNALLICQLKLYWGFKYTRLCIINRILGLKQLWLQVNS